MRERPLHVVSEAGLAHGGARLQRGEPAQYRPPLALGFPPGFPVRQRAVLALLSLPLRAEVSVLPLPPVRVWAGGVSQENKEALSFITGLRLTFSIIHRSALRLLFSYLSVSSVHM